MKFSADSVTTVVLYNIVASSLAVFLNRMADITEAVAYLSFFNCIIQAVFGYFQKVFRFIGYFPDREGCTAVAVKTFIISTYVNAYNVAFVNNLILARNAVDYFIVYRNAGTGRKSAIADPG